MPRIPIDPFLIKLLLVVAAGSLFPAHGMGAGIFAAVTNAAIALLFFMHGARLSREAIVAGIGHWRLHLTILSMTFAAFPVVGLLIGPVIKPFITPTLYSGLLFLCCLPSTVQASIAFTSTARGNVPAAVCSASASSLLGVFLTPLLIGLVMLGEGSGGVPISFDIIGKIVLQLLLPFIAGHAMRPWIGAWAMRNKSLLKVVDQGSILLVVYTAFSAAVVGGLWSRTSAQDLVILAVICFGLLALLLAFALGVGRAIGFPVEDRITLLFCGANKSLATGIPMANIIFAGQAVGAIVLPLMIYHQIQLLTGAFIAGRYARRPDGSLKPASPR